MGERRWRAGTIRERSGVLVSRGKGLVRSRQEGRGATCSYREGELLCEARVNTITSVPYIYEPGRKTEMGFGLGA
jgi:hypothetical protein